jgi:hypothetical protein
LFEAFFLYFQRSRKATEKKKEQSWEQQRVVGLIAFSQQGE